MGNLDDRELDDAMRQVRGTWRPWLLLVLTLGIAIYGGYELRRKHVVAERAVLEVDARIAEKVAQMVVLEETKTELERRIERIDKENQSLAELRKLEEEKKEQQAVNRVRFGHLESKISEKTAKEIGGGLMRLGLDDALEIQMLDKLLFDGSEPIISAKGQEVLLIVGTVLTSTTGIELEIAAHTDESPTAWETSALRAAVITRWFAEKARFDATKMTAVAHGASRPVAPNKNTSGRAKNRRIEITVTIPGDDR